MNIKQTADASGVSARNIRYYEQAGLLTPARNPENDYRIYTDADVRTLKLIRVLRTLDMPVEDIRAVLSGTLPLTEAAERQRRQLEAEQQKLAAAAAFCAYVLETGRITLSGTGKELMESDAVRKAYLGG